ncbi:hypothetical protein M405DRAFT_189313 [Rhizopogon salebrosus TDB-379]|nr:hypothetical protein M405DRAFT_189313 [Rhizopogon salebrosus TDB-379]
MSGPHRGNSIKIRMLSHPQLTVKRCIIIEPSRVNRQVTSAPPSRPFYPTTQLLTPSHPQGPFW